MIAPVATASKRPVHGVFELATVGLKPQCARDLAICLVPYVPWTPIQWDARLEIAGA